MSIMKCEAMQNLSRRTMLKGMALAGAATLVPYACPAETRAPNKNEEVSQATGDPKKETLMSHFSTTLVIPDSLLAKEATELLREHSTDLLINHSMRVYFFAVEQGRQRKLRFDSELLYVAAAFHDFGLLKKYSSADQRFEVDGANAVRQFLTAHKVPEDRIQLAWETIALHTTPGITQYMRPEVSLLYSAVGLDALGRGLDQFPSDVRETIVAKYPRKHFKEVFIQEYFGGFAHKPATTYGTVNAAICERLLPGYKSANAYDLITASPFPDSV